MTCARPNALIARLMAVLAAVLAALALGVAGCAASAPRPVAPSADSPMAGLDAPTHQGVWLQWTPLAEPRPLPVGFTDHHLAFDRWTLDDEAAARLWAGLFPVLDRVRHEGDSEAIARTVQLMMEALEPGDHDIFAEATFIRSADAGGPGTEAVAIRFARDLGQASPQLIVVLARPLVDEEDGQMREAVVWAAPGFEEAAPFTLHLRQDDGWQATLGEGLTWRDDAGQPVADAELIAAILGQPVWKQITGRAYLDATLRAAQGGQPPAPLAPALGLPQRERSLDQVMEATMFPPRMDDFQPSL